MTWLLYIANAALARTESALGKYSGRRGGNPHTFNLGKTVAAAGLCALLALIVGFEYHTDTLILALIYGGTLALSMHAGFMALSLGNMAIVSMIASFSLIIPVFWGLAFLNETVTVFGIIGLVFAITARDAATEAEEIRRKKISLAINIIAVVLTVAFMISFGIAVWQGGGIEAIMMQ